MFKQTLSKIAFVTAGATLSLGVMQANPAQAAGFSFTQGGFTGGGTLSGMFSGEDNNGDSIIDYFELTNWMVSWSGDSIIPDFTHNSVENIVPDADSISFAYFIPDNVLAFFASADDALNPETPNNNFAVAFAPGFDGFTLVSNTDALEGIDLDDIGECIAANACSVSIDQIEVQPKSESVPEPGMGYGALALGLLGIGGMLKKKLS